MDPVRSKKSEISADRLSVNRTSNGVDRETNTNSIFVFIFGFVSGILVSSWVFVSPLLSVLAVFLGAIILVAEKISKQKLEKEILFLSLALLSFGLGALRYSIKDFHEPQIRRASCRERV